MNLTSVLTSVGPIYDDAGYVVGQLSPILVFVLGLVFVGILVPFIIDFIKGGSALSVPAGSGGRSRSSKRRSVSHAAGGPRRPGAAGALRVRQSQRSVNTNAASQSSASSAGGVVVPFPVRESSGGGEVVNFPSPSRVDLPQRKAA